MRKALFIIAFLFLANPLISNVDILPDVVAYVLIMIALSKPSYFNSKAFSAYKSARTMAIVSLCKLVSVYFSTVYFNDTTSLLFSFTFFVVELIFGIPLLLKLFGYFSSLSLQTENKRANNAIDIFKIIAIVVFALRLFLATIPDFAVLTEGDTITSSLPDLTRFRPLFILFSLVLSIPLSGVWIILNTVLISVLFGKREEQYIKEEFKRKIQNKAQHYEIKANYRFLFILGACVLLAFDLRIDNVNMLINTILPIAFICVYLFFIKKKYAKFNKLFYALLGTSVVQLVFRILELKTSIDFSKEYKLEAVLKVSRAETLYFRTIPFAAIGTVLFCITVSLMLILLIKMSSDMQRKYSSLSVEETEYNIKAINNKVRIFAIVTTVFAALHTISYPLMIYFLPENQFIEEIVIFGEMRFNIPIYSIFMPINIIISALFVVSFILTLLVLYDGVYKKMYEKISLN